MDAEETMAIPPVPGFSIEGLCPESPPVELGDGFWLVTVDLKPLCWLCLECGSDPDCRICGPDRKPDGG